MATVEEKQEIIKRCVYVALGSTKPFYNLWLEYRLETGKYRLMYLRRALKNKAKSVVYYDRILNSAMKVYDVQLNTDS